MEQQVQGVVQHDDPPPPYRKSTPLEIRRKPVANSKANPHNGNYNVSNGDGHILMPAKCHEGEKSKEQIQPIPPHVPTNFLSRTSPVPSAPGPIRDVGPVLNPQSASMNPVAHLKKTSGSPNGSSAPRNGTSAAAGADLETASWKKTASEYAQRGFQEARHFVGGLVAHPSVSNKHYTILRHSNGVVFYQGSTTYLAISIFVDEPLPNDRTIWMQCKGYSGKTGMRAKAFLGLNDSWINVTPTIAIRSDHVNAHDERAWQRDIQRFRKKASESPLNRHILRETAVVRVPVEAADGYYQLVLCHGDQKRKPLCTSPVFRLCSTSSDPSMLRGASLATLPLELGLWVGGLYAQSAASSFLAPVTTHIQHMSLMPSSKTRTAMQTAYSASGLQDRVDSSIEDADSCYNKSQTEIYTHLGPVEATTDSGPAAPYPLDFVANFNLPGPTATFDLNGYPRKISMVGVPRNILPRLDGQYFAWCKILLVNDQTSNSFDKNAGVDRSWLQCIVSASSIVFQEQLSNVRSSRALKTTTSIKIIEDIDIPSTARVQVRIMGFIRPSKAVSTAIMGADSEAKNEEQIMLDVCDIEFTRRTLNNIAWQADNITIHSPSEGQRPIDGGLEKETTQSGIWDRAKGGYVNMRLKGQTMAGQIPLHRAGIRVKKDQLLDKNIAVGGYFIPR